jgi:hypothetical protein
MADRYGKQLVEDVEYRQEQVEKVSSFSHRYLGYMGYKSWKASLQPNV